MAKIDILLQLVAMTKPRYVNFESIDFLKIFNITDNDLLEVSNDQGITKFVYRGPDYLNGEYIYLP